MASQRAVPHVRKALGQRLRMLRKARRMSQAGLGTKAGLSGKFVGEVERGEKSISIDSLYRVAQALGIPLAAIASVATKNRQLPSPGVEEVYALLSARSPREVGHAVKVVRAMLSA